MLTDYSEVKRWKLRELKIMRVSEETESVYKEENEE
jgi:hypothetical protein